MTLVRIEMNNQEITPVFVRDRRNAGDERLVINISGHRFDTWRHTLETYPDTLLGSSKRESYYDETSREYFFERDAEIFRHILNYYTTGELHFPRNECSASYDRELKFFGISTVIGNCCFKNYSERMSENVELHKIDGNSDAHQTSPTSTRQRMWRGCEDPHSSNIALAFRYVTIFVSIVFIVMILIETVPCGMRPGRAGTLSCGERYKTSFFLVTFACIIIFTLEYLIQLYAAPSRRQFIFSFMGIIDILVIAPFFIGLLMPDNEDVSGVFFTLRVFRILLLFRFSRQCSGLRIVGHTLNTIGNKLGVLFMSFTMGIFTFASLMFYAEKNVDGTNFTSIPAAAWYTVVTMTSLGYGDMVPETILGKIIGGLCSFCGVFFLAFSVVVLSDFNRIYHLKEEQMKVRSARIRIPKKPAVDTILNIS